MERRLYFLFPDRDQARATLADLESAGLKSHQLYLVESPEDTRDFQREERIARLAWRLNLGLFALAGLALLVLLWQGHLLWSLLPLALMLASFLLGERFTHLPDVQMEEFRDALHHGEVLLMVDVPRERVAEIEHRVSGRHPEAVPGGTRWHTDLLPH